MSKTRKPIPKPDWAKDRWANPNPTQKTDENKQQEPIPVPTPDSDNTDKA